MIFGSKILSFRPHLRVDVHKLVTYLNQTPIFEWYVFRCDSENGTKRDWIASSKYDNRLRLDNQNNWRNLYDHLMNMQFSLIINKIHIRAPKTARKVPMVLIWMLNISYYHRLYTCWAKNAQLLIN